MVNTWYEVDAVNSDTIIYYGAVSGFAYYVRQSRQYSDTTENRVNYMDWCRDKNEDEYREYVDSIYGDRWPGEIYVVASHTRDDVNTLVSSIMNVIRSLCAGVVRLRKTIRECSGTQDRTWEPQMLHLISGVKQCQTV